MHLSNGVTHNMLVLSVGGSLPWHLLWCASAGSVHGAQPPASLGLAPASTTPNPQNPFAFAMANNIYLTSNYFIGAYHYVQCFGTNLVIPKDTAETAQAIAYYYKQAQVGGEEEDEEVLHVCVSVCLRRNDHEGGREQAGRLTRAAQVSSGGFLQLLFACTAWC